MKRSTTYFAIILLFFIALSENTNGQERLTIPMASPWSEVKQTIGLTEVHVTYNSPQVNGREIWGKLVPYGQVWRCGANANTTISFSTEVMVEGKKLAAGKYGLHMIPTQDKWTVIFSNDNQAWGSYFYNKSKDALRVEVAPKIVEHHEWLTYEFPERGNESAILAMRWEKISVPVKIEVDLVNRVIDNMRNELTSLSGFFWQANNQAAAYCLQHNTNHEEALVWTSRSIGYNRNFTNLMTKAGLLEQTGKKEEAAKLKKEAMPLANEAQLNAYGYQLLGQGKTDEAIDIFKKNVKDHPKSWNVYDSLADGYKTKGDKVNAIKNFKKALEMAPEGQHPRIKHTIEELEG